jgi:hypothetical protein
MPALDSSGLALGPTTVSLLVDACGQYHRRVLIRCTAKLLRAIGTPTASLVDAPPSDKDWYANLLWFSGRKCVLLTHAGTLFSVFVPEVPVVDLRPFGGFVVPVIEASVRSEGLSVNIFGPLDPDGVGVAKTANRSVLGCMNDLALHCEYAIDDAGGLDLLDVEELNRGLRRTILGPLGGAYPIEAAGG